MAHRSNGQKSGGATPPGQVLIDAMRDEVSVEDWRDIVRAVIENAKKGDAKARTWLSDHLLGKPTPRKDGPTPPDRTPIKIEWGDD